MTEQPPKKSLKDTINEQIAFLDLGTTDDIVRDIKRGIHDLIGLVIKKPPSTAQVRKTPAQHTAHPTVQTETAEHKQHEPLQNTALRPAAMSETKMTVHTFADPGEKHDTAPTVSKPEEPVAVAVPAPAPEPVYEPVSVTEPVKEEIPVARAVIEPPAPPAQPEPVMPEQHIKPPPLAESYEPPKHLIDNKMVKSLFTSLGENTFRELYSELWIKADSILALLNKALDEHNMKTINERGHEMKGMCANFGLCGVSSVCRDIEESGMREDYATASLLIPHIPELLNETHLIIDDFLSGKLIISNLEEEEKEDRSGYMI